MSSMSAPLVGGKKLATTRARIVYVSYLQVVL